MLFVWVFLTPQTAYAQDEFSKNVEDWLKANLGSYGPTLANSWRDHQTLCYIALAALALLLFYGIFVLIRGAVTKISESNSGLGRLIATWRIPRLLKKQRFVDAANLLKRLDQRKEAADAYFQGQFWNEAAEIYFDLGIKLKAARAYENLGNLSTAAITFEELGEFEAAERCYRQTKDLRSVAKMYSKIGQHKRAASLFKEMGLSRDQAEALELAGLHEDSLAIWRELFGNYKQDAGKLTPLALRERNTVAAHVFRNTELIDEDEAQRFLATITLPQGIPDVFQKRGEFQKAADVKAMITKIEQEKATGTAQNHPRSGPTPNSASLLSSPRTGRDSRQALKSPGRNLNRPAASRLGRMQAQKGGGQSIDSAQEIDRSQPSRQDLRPGFKESSDDPQRIEHTQDIGQLPKPAAPTPTSLNNRAQILMNQRDYSAAGDLFEEAGNYMRAIDAYELALACPEGGFSDEQPLSAWQRELIDRIQWLYKRNGSPELAAEFLQRIGRRSDAADLFAKVGNNERAAQILEEDKNFEAAAQIYQQIGDSQRSIRCLAQASVAAGDLPRAGDLYAEIGDKNIAASLYDEARAKGILKDHQWRELMNALNPKPSPPPHSEPRRKSPSAQRRSGSIPRSRRPSRVAPLPRNLQADVSALHRLPGSIVDGHPPSKARRAPSRVDARQSGSMRPNPKQGHQTPRSGVRRQPTRRLSGAASRVLNQGPPPPRPPTRQNARRTSSGLRRPQSPPPSPQSNSGGMRRSNTGGIRRSNTGGIRRPAPSPLPSITKATGIFRRNSGGDNNHSLMVQAASFEQKGMLKEAADLYLQTGSNAQARDLYKQLSDWKSVADTWQADSRRFEAGVLYFVLGKIQEAIRELTKVPDNNPDCMAARRVVAILYGLLGQLDDAKTYFDASFTDTVGADDIEALYYYAQVLEQNQQTWDDALDIYSTVLELNSQFRNTRGRMNSLQQGRPQPISSIYEDAEQDQNSLFYMLQEAVMAR
jgi:tetratricopeptide (TPR) repeat protein